jgi:hypothetical protein
VGQQVLAHGGRPLWQDATAPRHVLVVGLAHATPAWQHALPHGV